MDLLVAATSGCGDDLKGRQNAYYPDLEER
jgi:hypothetical protein